MKISLLRVVPVLLLSGTFLRPAMAQFFPSASSIEATKKQFPNLKFELVLPKKQYALGEPIEVTMRYLNTGKEALTVELVNYDRSGRIMDFGFSATNAAGQKVRDPFTFGGGMMGGLRSSKPLVSGQPFEQKATVNEWLSFDEPGTYQLRAYSGIIMVPKEGQNGWGDAISLQSDPITLEIGPPDEAARQLQFKTATSTLNEVEKRILTLSPTLESYKRNEQIGPEINQIMRGLRWLNDPRAIPFLIRGLEIGGTAGFEAHRGLVSFPDLTSVRAALINRLKNGSPVTEGVWYFKDLLGRSSAASEKAPPSFALSPEDEALFNAPLRDSLHRSLDAHDEKQASRDAALLLQNDKSASRDKVVWESFWPGASSLPEDKQWAGAVLLLQEAKTSLYPVATASLQGAARNERLSKELRSACVVALARRNDFSLRSLLAQDLTSQQPHFTSAAYATLGDYEARPIALKLLALLRQPDGSSVFAKDDLAKRLRDFGGGATPEELIDATRWMMANFPVGQGFVLEAVALRDQKIALALLQESMAKQPISEYSDSRFPVLVKLDTPEAQAFRQTLLTQKNENFMKALLGQIGAASQDSHSPNDVDVTSPSAGQKHLQPNRALYESLVPEITKIYLDSPSNQLREAAKNTLRTLTQLWSNSNESNPEEKAKWRAQLSTWWKQNAARLGRADVTLPL